MFGPVWSVLYSTIGYASWRVWQAGGGPVPLGLYGAQLLLNFAWSPIFFKKHDLKLASYEITALLGMVGATIYEFNKVDPLAAKLMLPYLAWTSFATALTWNIHLNNPEVRFSAYFRSNCLFFTFIPLAPSPHPSAHLFRSSALLPHPQQPKKD